MSAFWSVPLDQVIKKTGAIEVMDCSDLQQVLDHFEVDLSNKRVIDVGCGTGRLSKLCGDYQGFDITPSMVQYARNQGLKAFMVSDLEVAKPVDYVTCFSVFTHISRSERQDYLGEFRRVAPKLIVDIIPGEEHGDEAIWYADPVCFEQDLGDHGFDFVSWDFNRIPTDGVMHRYYHANAR